MTQPLVQFSLPLQQIGRMFLESTKILQKGGNMDELEQSVAFGALDHCAEGPVFSL